MTVDRKKYLAPVVSLCKRIADGSTKSLLSLLFPPLAKASAGYLTTPAEAVFKQQPYLAIKNTKLFMTKAEG